MQVLIFSAKVIALYDSGLRIVLAPLFLASFSPFSELVSNIHLSSGCQMRYTCVNNASICCPWNCAGYSPIFIFKLGACTFKVENLNFYLHFSKFFSPVIYFLSLAWFFTDDCAPCPL